jgi:VCBS repeat-containing protein
MAAATKATSKGANTVAFGNTPQARDDAFGFTQAASGKQLLDVMGNDSGGNAKSLWSLDDGDRANDLLTARSSAVSANGVAISIVNGQVAYDMAGLGSLAALAKGETFTDSFTYAIQLGSGVLSWATARITITGTNDAPVLQAASAAVAEDSVVTGRMVATDVDHGARLTYSAAATAGLTFNADGTWRFDAGDAAYQSLGQGQTRQVVVEATVTDEWGASSTAKLALTVTGVNDGPTGAPVIAGEAKVGETLTASAGNLADADGVGALTFTWQSQGADGAWTNVGTGETHVVATGEAGSALRVVASYVDGGGVAEAASSAATAAVTGDEAGGFRMDDIVFYASVRFGSADVFRTLTTQGASDAGVAFEVLQNPSIARVFGGMDAMFGFIDGLILKPDWLPTAVLSNGTLPAGEVAVATVRATDRGTGATEIGTITLRVLAEDVGTFHYVGGAGGDVFLLPNGHGIVEAGTGNDLVQSLGADGDLVVDLGDGDDSTNLGRTYGNLTVTNSGGRDDVFLDAVYGDLAVASSGVLNFGVNYVNDDAAIRAGEGDDYLRVSGVQGALLIQTGGGSDYVEVSGSQGGLAIDLGTGDTDSANLGNIADGVSIRAGALRTSVVANYTFGNLEITGTGESLGISAQSVFGDLSVSVESGSLYVNAGGIYGNLTVRGGNGTDYIYASYVQGSADIQGGGGDDFLAISGAYGGATVDGGAGRDFYDLIYLTGAGGAVVVLRAGEVDGDILNVFQGGGAGQKLLLAGFGPGATLSLVSQGTSADGYSFDSEWRIDDAGVESTFIVRGNGYYPAYFDPNTDVIWA